MSTIWASVGPPTKAAVVDAGSRFRHVETLVPYGVWTTASGREVIFDRQYVPLLERVPDEPARLADPTEWVPFVSQRWLFGDYDSPWAKGSQIRAADEEVNALLQEWGLPQLPPAPRRTQRQAWPHALPDRTTAIRPTEGGGRHQIYETGVPPSAKSSNCSRRSRVPLAIWRRRQGNCWT